MFRRCSGKRAVLVASRQSFAAAMSLFLFPRSRRLSFSLSLSARPTFFYRACGATTVYENISEASIRETCWRKKEAEGCLCCRAPLNFLNLLNLGSHRRVRA